MAADWPPPLFADQPGYTRLRAQVAARSSKQFANELKKRLIAPIKAYRMPEGTARWAAIDAETRVRIEAAFALFDIPDDFDELTQWRQLGVHLLGAHFRGCRTLFKGRGGAKQSRRDEWKRRQHELAPKYEVFRNNHPDLKSDSVAAALFIKKFPVDCAAARLTKPKSFTQAIRRLKKTGI